MGGAGALAPRASRGRTKGRRKEVQRARECSVSSLNTPYRYIEVSFEPESTGVGRLLVF